MPEAARVVLRRVLRLHQVGDLIEHRVDDVLDVALIQVRILRGDLLHKLGFDHCGTAVQSLMTGRA